MKHRILVLGAGYAGAFAAGSLVRRLSPTDTEITVVNAEPVFVERMRNHQLAAGRELATVPLADVFAGTGLRLHVARVTAVDPERKSVVVTGEDGDGELGYDTLLYTLGSRVADHGVPGVAEHAFDVAGRPSALRLRAHLDNLGQAGTVLVVGEGLTGIETATEIAESRPGLSVALAAHGELGARLSPGARLHLREAFDRLGVTVHEHTAIEAVGATYAIGADGTSFPADATVWTAGFAVAPIAAAAGLEVTEDGRIVVDDTMRSVSHPDIHAAGDSAYTIGDNGRPLPMSCASAGYTTMQATDAIVGRLTGRRVPRGKKTYFGNHISLGRYDAIFQMVDDDVRAKSWFVGGRKAARLKAGILRTSLWATSHPTFGMPKRKRHLTSTTQTAGTTTAVDTTAVATTPENAAA
ncbi:NAD(P)/FAD-dependent oxidoreductase [Streptomyces canus]|uniref:NAD(P)/FAD-dependent oxidoreductase n=1 Tax=Streptomyces canus TaxID=58343 RepID=UPI002E35BBCD|nr:FAD-dependent oxidoreductase [Streptomyces canus]